MQGFDSCHKARLCTFHFSSAEYCIRVDRTTEQPQSFETATLHAISGLVCGVRIGRISIHFVNEYGDLGSRVQRVLHSTFQTML